MDLNDSLLGKQGLKHLIERFKSGLNNKVDKKTGMGLSSNDYTNADKTKLDSIYPNALQLHVVTADGSSVTTQWKKFLEGNYNPDYNYTVHVIFKTSEHHIYHMNYSDSQNIDSILHVHLRLQPNYKRYELNWEYANPDMRLDNFKICVNPTSGTFACYWKCIKAYNALNLQTLYAHSNTPYQLVDEDMGETEPVGELNAYSTVYSVHPDMVTNYIGKSDRTIITVIENLGVQNVKTSVIPNNFKYVDIDLIHWNTLKNDNAYITTILKHCIPISEKASYLIYNTDNIGLYIGSSETTEAVFRIAVNADNIAIDAGKKTDAGLDYSGFFIRGPSNSQYVFSFYN